jgi:acylglycerol kinase
MERVRKVGTTLRTHWKKSIFLTLAGAYGGNWYKKKLEDTDLMRQCCREALTYGATPIGVHQQNYHVTVVLNPASSGGKARKLFEQYSAPLLHLAGFKVSVQKTEGREEAKELLKIMENCDAVLVAGGDGTVMEAVTGLMRREDSQRYRGTPIGVIPVGQNNSLANRLFPIDDQVRQLAESTMAVIRQLKRPVDIIEIENLSADEEMRGRKLYGLNGIQMGAWKEADARKDSYWFFGGLKHRLTYVFSYLTGHKEVTWDWPLGLSALTIEKVTPESTQQVEPTPPPQRRGGLAGFFSSSSNSAPKPVSPEVETVETWQEPPVTMEAGQIEVSLGEHKDLILKTFPNNTSFSEFVLEGWTRLKVRPMAQSGLDPKIQESTQFKLDTFTSPESPKLMWVDGEEVELTGPIRVSLLPNVLTMFCQESDAVKVSQPATQTPPPSRWSSRGVSSSLMSGQSITNRL